MRTDVYEFLRCLTLFLQAWRRTGDALSEMLQFRSAIEYYEVALKLDASLIVPLSPTIERLRVLERIVGGIHLCYFIIKS